MNRILFFFIATVLVFTSVMSYAAFPAKKEQLIEQKRIGQDVKRKLSSAVIQFKNTESKSDDSYKAKDAFGIVSLVTGILGVIFMFIPVVALVSIPMAVMALVMGILGLKGSNQGLAIAGIIIGGVELLVLILFVVVLAALFSVLL